MLTLETTSSSPDILADTSRVSKSVIGSQLARATFQAFARASETYDMNTTAENPNLVRDVLKPSASGRFFVDLDEAFLELFKLTVSKRFLGLYPAKHPNSERDILKREVCSLLEKAGTENWDGAGALELQKDTVDIAQELIDQLPPHADRPDIAATPHGEVDFDWVVDRNVMLTISVTPSKEIAFAGLFDNARLTGRELWRGKLPHFANCWFERLRDA